MYSPYSERETKNIENKVMEKERKREKSMSNLHEELLNQIES